MSVQFGMTAQMKDLFFDRAYVKRQVGKWNMQALSRIGGRVRLRSRRSLRRRKKSSPPGQPPSVHSKDSVATLKNILFAYDPRHVSVLIGPVRLNQVNDLAAGGRIGVPELMEKGGTASILEKKIVNPQTGQFEWVRVDRRRKVLEGQQRRQRAAQYAPRPFMGPALNAEIPNFPSLWVA